MQPASTTGEIKGAGRGGARASAGGTARESASAAPVIATPGCSAAFRRSRTSNALMETVPLPARRAPAAIGSTLAGRSLGIFKAAPRRDDAFSDCLRGGAECRTFRRVSDGFRHAGARWLRSRLRGLRLRPQGGDVAREDV